MAAAAACLSSAGPCPSLSSCLCRAGPGWPPDLPLPHALCLCPCPQASGKAYASLLGGGDVVSLSLSVCVRGGSDRGRSLAPVCASWFSLALSLFISLSLLCGALCCDRWPVENLKRSTNKEKKSDVKRIRSGRISLAPPGTCQRAIHV